MSTEGKPRHLADVPIGEDHFASRAQRRMSDVIAGYIRSQKICRKVGIEGSWGSGKSNLVKMLTSNETLSNYRFFIYDAWAHQTDMPRRAFIEEFVSFLKKNSLLKSATPVEAKRDEVLGSVTTLRTLTESSFSWSTFWLVLSAIVTPACVSLSSIFQESSCWKNLIVAIPAAFVVLAVLSLLIDYHKEKDVNVSFCTYARDHLLGAFRKDATSTAKNEYKHQIEPLSSSFYEFFGTVESNLKPDKRVILVIDNMDRLPSDKLQRIWTMIQSFFGSEDTMYLHRFQIIVPFDRNHLHLFDVDKDEALVSAYLDKIFDVVFRVPLPSLQDWEGYFDEKWEEAFGSEELSKQELDSVRRIFDCYQETITPRTIIRFINEMVTLSLMDENHEIKNQYKAVFICKKSYILKYPLDALADLSYLGALQQTFEVDKKFYQSLTALCYQVPLDRDEETVAYRALKLALRNGDGETVTHIARLPSFSSMLGKIILTLSDKEIHCAICAMGNLTPEQLGGEKMAETRWRELYIKVQREFQNGVYKILDNDSADYLEDYIAVLLRHVDGDDCKSLVNEILNMVKDMKNLSAERYYRTVNHLNDLVKPKGIDVFLSLEDMIFTWNRNLKDLLFQLSKEKRLDGFEKYRMRSRDEEVDHEISFSMGVGDWNRPYIDFLVDTGYNFSECWNRLRTFLETGRDLPISEWLELLSLYIKLKPEDKQIVFLPQSSALLRSRFIDWMGQLEGGCTVANMNRKEKEICSVFVCLMFRHFRYEDITADPRIHQLFSSVDLVDEVCKTLPKVMEEKDFLALKDSYREARLYQEVYAKIHGDSKIS